MIADKLLLEEQLEETQGEITDDLDLIWQQNDLAIKDKIDTYGQLFDELDAEKKKLALLKESGVHRIQAAMDRIESLEMRLKRRLNLLSGGQKLKGNLYSFNPFLSRQRTLKNLELLDKHETYVNLNIREDILEELINFWTKEKGVVPFFEVKKRSGRISELPDDHPSIETVYTPSVRIT